MSQDSPTASTQVTATGAADFVHELGYLKRTPRTGWAIAGIEKPESVAEHSFRTAAIAFVLASSVAEADASHAALLALFHDVPEARTGDIPSIGKPYLRKTPDPETIKDQVRAVHPLIAERLEKLVEEYSDQQSVEAQLARDADKIECLAQALEYNHRGYRETEHWIKGSYESVRTPAGRRFADELMEASPIGWWSGAVDNYRSGGRPQ